MDIKDEIRRAATAAMKKSEINSSFFTEPSAKQISNATHGFAAGCRPEDVAALYDLTLFNSGKKGIVFAAEGIYSSDMDLCVDKGKRTKQPLRYDDILTIKKYKSEAVIKHMDGTITRAYFGNDTARMIRIIKDIRMALGLMTGEEVPASEDIPVEEAIPEAEGAMPAGAEVIPAEEERTLAEEKTISKEGTFESSADNILILNDQNGGEVRFEFLDLISYGGKDYIVLIQEEDYEDGPLTILEVEENEAEGTESYIGVESEEILGKVLELFRERAGNDSTEAEQSEKAAEERPVPYDGKEPYIFISYSHKDSDTVLTILKQMQHDGFRIWYDDGIDPGSEWDEYIADHLERSSCFIAFMSENYVGSSNCRDEVNYARDLDLNRLLIYLDDVKLTGGMAMRLNRLQALYYHKYQLKPMFYKRLYDAGVLSGSGTRVQAES